MQERINYRKDVNKMPKSIKDLYMSFMLKPNITVTKLTINGKKLLDENEDPVYGYEIAEYLKENYDMNQEISNIYMKTGDPEYDLDER
jgi:hypothetical protein